MRTIIEPFRIKMTEALPITTRKLRVARLAAANCNNFLASSENWAERAADLGWNAVALFGCRRHRPLVHLGSAGLLWAINGGRILELHRGWALFALPPNESPRIFDRRRLDAANVTLPWCGT